ncbi:MAG: DUF3592 domain-containing protein [Lachnospiraceae bacterium]|nr:DUF3592 domain-containing protein [Lachnospiraceae bacterium]
MVNNITNSKSGKIKKYIIYGIFMIIGIVILAVGVIYAYTKWEFKKNAVEISATIVDIQSGYDSNGDKTYTTYVNYEYDGVQYEYINLGYYSINMYVGKEITLLCDPDNPYKIDLGSGIIIVSVVLIVIGLAFIAFGFFSFIMARKGIRRYKCVMAKVDYVEHNTNITSKERHPFIIHCTYTDMNTGKQYSFKSPNLWTDTDLSFVYYPGMMIPVYINGNNFNDYMIDTESLIGNGVEGYT